MSSEQAVLADRDSSGFPAPEAGAGVSRIALRNFRSYETADASLSAGVTVVHGAVGAGKTNFLEAIYFGCTGKSCRTNNARELVRFGERVTHVSVAVSNEGLDRTLEIGFELGGEKALKVDGARVERIEPAERPLLCVFMPDRLELVKGTGASRRPHLDSLIAALWPGREETRRSYGRALAQRNALLAGIRSRRSTGDGLAGWNHELARHGLDLMRARTAAVELLAAPFAAYADQLGMQHQASLTYVPRSRATTIEELEAELDEALEHDVARGFTTHGPHRDDFRFDAGEKDLRRFGSQGQQRLALLALLLAEREALEEVRRKTPMLLLDDVFSELDRVRRACLVDVLARGGQALITTADLAAVRSLSKQSADRGAFDELEVLEGRIKPSTMPVLR